MMTLADTVMNIVPLVAGIEHFKVAIRNLDTSPASVDVTTGSTSAMAFPILMSLRRPTLAQSEDMSSQSRASVLARSLKTTNGYADSKAFTVGPLAVAASGRCIINGTSTATEVRPNNLSLAGERYRDASAFQKQNGATLFVALIIITNDDLVCDLINQFKHD